MALITNLSSTNSVDIINRAGVKYTILPSGTLTVNNQDLLYQNFAAAVFAGYITVTGWSDPTVGGGGSGQVGVLPAALGQTIKSASLPVVLPSDQTVPVSGTVSVNALPAGANSIGAVTANAGTNLNTSALALETGGNLAGINTKLPALGAHNTAGSVAVNVASDQTVPVSIAANVAIIDAYQAPVVTSWTSATALNTAVSMTTNGYDTVIVTIVPPAGLTGGVITFNVFDGATWIPVKAFRTDSYLSDSSFSVAGSPAVHAWQVPVAGFPQFQFKLTSVIVGSGTVTITSIVSSAPDTSGVTVGLDPNSPLPAGTNALGSVIPIDNFGITQTSVAVTASSQQLIGANAARKYLAWMVVGTQAVTIVPGATAVAGAGFVYSSGGTNLQGASQEWPHGAPTTAFNVIATATGSTVYVWEGV